MIPEEGKASRYHHDFTSSSMEIFNYIFYNLNRVGQFLLVEKIGVLGEHLRPVVSHNIHSGSFRLDFGTVLTVWYVQFVVFISIAVYVEFR